jgi:predicted Fe-S protein YdhL (DUF1289 family)
MEDPNQEECHVQSGEVWSQLSEEQQAHVIRLLSQMAYRFFVAQAEKTNASAKMEGRSNGPSHTE